MPVEFFSSIKISVPYNGIYSRLGYAKGRTRISREQREEIEKYINDALVLIDLKGSASRVPIKRIDSEKIIISEKIIFKSQALAKLLVNCQEVLFMGATAGKRIVNSIEKNFQGKNITGAVVFDGVASQMADAALDWIVSYCNRQLRRENKYLTERRFSAGYGDFSLDNQRIIWETLKLKRLGVSLTEKNMFIPEKTVTALAGILEI